MFDQFMLRIMRSGRLGIVSCGSMSGLSHRRPPASYCLSVETQTLLPAVKCHKVGILRGRGEVERRGNVPEVRATQVASVKSPLDFRGQRPLRQYPLDTGNEIRVELAIRPYMRRH